MRRSLPRLITFGLGSALVLLIGNALFSYRNIERLIQHERSVNHTYQVLIKLEQTLSTLKDAETGQRGYLLTGKERYLDPYERAIAQVNQQMRELQQLTSDNPKQQEQIQALEQAINAKLAELEATLYLRRNQGAAMALRLVQTDRGKQLMQEIRRQIGAMEAAESKLLEQQSQQSAVRLHFTLFTFTLASGLSLLLLALVYYLIKRDQWQRQQAEAELRASEQQFKATFNQAAVGIAHVGLNGTWLLVNQRLCDIVGYPYEELLERTFQDITYPADLDKDLEYVRRILANEIQTYSLEKRYICKNGGLIWVQLTVSLARDADGTPQYFISVVEDISDRKQAEAKVHQLNATLEQRVEERTVQLQEVNQAMEAFTYSVSHDLRAPLRTMQGFAQALLEDYNDHLDSMGQKYIHYVMEGAQEMDALITDLLSYSRLSRAEISLQPVAFTAVIEEALRQLSAQIQEQQAEIHVAASLAIVMAHRATLVQVVTNLIGNALKFVPPNVQPQVQIWTEDFNVQTQPQTSCWSRLWVQDNGIGIAPEHQDRIFRIFERLHGVEVYPGTGIGLAIVRKGIQRMGGQVGVESQPGQGSRFWIELPASEHP